MGEQEFIFNLTEMNLVSVGCPNCYTKIIFDASMSDTGLPQACPVCNRDMKAAGRCLGLYREFYRQMLGTGQPFEVRVRSKA